MNTYSFAITILLSASAAGTLSAQVIRPMRPFSTEGTLKSVARGSVIMNDKSGRLWQLRMAGSDGVVSLGKNLRFQARKPLIEVSGSLGKADMQTGMAVQFECFISDEGRIQQPVTEVKWLDSSKAKGSAKLNKKKSNENGETHCLVSGTIDQVDRNGFTVRIPRSRLADNGTIAVPLADDVKFTVKTRDLSKAREGDVITDVSGVELSTGDFVIQKLAVRLIKKPASATDSTDNPTDRKRNRKPATPVAKVLDSKYEQLSDTPVPPRIVRDRFVWVTTDLSDRKTRMLIDELTEELTLLATFYQRPPTAPLECYVVSDPQAWPAPKLPAKVLEAITNKTAELVPQSGGSGSRSKQVAIYAPANTKLIRGELVKAYCYQVFGGIGPDWYSEGMSEMGKQWKAPINEVQLDAELLKVFTKIKNPKTIEQIIDGESAAAPEDPPKSDLERRRREGAKNRQRRELAAYRWALCFMLSNNPNYQRKFKELGVKLMMDREGSIEETFGKVIKQLTFEFEQFTKNVDNGYRVDLAAWPWAHRFKDIDKSSTRQASIEAKLGWQPVALVEKDASYDMVTKGKWRIDGAGHETTAEGDKAGVGKLIAVILQDDYTLTEPIPIGKGLSFRSPAAGRLYARCHESWGALADNSGSIATFIRHAKKKKP